MFEAAVDRFGGAVGAAGPVEVGKDVLGSLVQGAAELAQLDQRLGDTGGESADDGPGLGAAGGAVGVAVGGDEPLVDAPRAFDLDVVITREECVEPLLLAFGEQVSAGVQGPSRGVSGSPLRPRCP